jgi:hypothetical protein
VPGAVESDRDSRVPELPFLGEPENCLEPNFFL